MGLLMNLIGVMLVGLLTVPVLVVLAVWRELEQGRVAAPLAPTRSTPTRRYPKGDERCAA